MVQLFSNMEPIPEDVWKRINDQVLGNLEGPVHKGNIQAELKKR